MTRDNIAPIAEEIIIEQQTVEELREQITNLQNELAEQKRHANKMDDLVWENLKAKEKSEKELEEEKKEKEQIKKELEAKNQIIDDLQKELAREKGWWDKWMNDGNDNIVEKKEFGGMIDYKKDYLIRAENNLLTEYLAKVMLIDEPIEKLHVRNLKVGFVSNYGREAESIYYISAKSLRQGKEIIKHVSEYYKWIYDYKK